MKSVWPLKYQSFKHITVNVDAVVWPCLQRRASILASASFAQFTEHGSAGACWTWRTGQWCWWLNFSTQTGMF